MVVSLALVYGSMLTTAATHKHFRGERCPSISDVFIDTRVFECSCHAWGSHRNWRQSSCCLQDGGEPAVRATTVLGTDISISTQTEYKHLLQWKLLHCPQPVVVAWCGPRSSSCQTCHIHCKFLSSVVVVGFINSVVVSASWSQPVSTPSANCLSNRIIYTETWTRSRWLKTHPAVVASSSCGSRNTKCCGWILVGSNILQNTGIMLS